MRQTKIDEFLELEHHNKELEKRVKEEVAKNREKDKLMFQQAKLASLGEMLGNIAHQWRQPLMEINSLFLPIEGKIFLDMPLDKEEILETINKLNHITKYMSNTIDDFRDFYKPDKMKEDFLVSNACKNAINIINATLKNCDIKLNINIQNDKNIHAYPTEFAQVILNILSNAKDVLVEKKIKNPKIDLTIDSRGILSIITIKDNAGGIDKKNQELIFDPYFSTKDSSKGTGLGLYISKLIIEKNMGGELSVYNDDEGAIFKIVIAG